MRDVRSGRGRVPSDSLWLGRAAGSADGGVEAALKTAGADEEAWAEQGWVGEAIEQDLGWAGQARDRVQISWIQQEDAGGQLFERQEAGSAGNGCHVVGQAPAGVEGPAPDNDVSAAEEGLKSGERCHGVEFVDGADEGSDGGAAGEGVGVAEGFGIGDDAGAVTGVHVGV